MDMLEALVMVLVLVVGVFIAGLLFKALLDSERRLNKATRRIAVVKLQIEKKLKED